MSELQCAVDEVDKEGWHEVLARFRDGCLMQTWSYAAARWPNAKLSHVVVSRDGSPLAAAQVVLWSLPVVGGGFALVHYGPLWKPRSGAPDRHALAYLLQQLQKEFIDRRRMSLRIKPQASARADDAEAICDALGRAGYRLEPDSPTDRFLVDLSPNMDELHASLSSKWRYNLKRAQRSGLDIHHVHGSAGVERFVSLYGEMLARKAFVDHSGIDALSGMYADLPEPMAPEILICEHEGKPVAGAVISIIGETAEYVFGATADSALQLRASYLLQWTTVGWLREQGMRWYDLGGGANNEGLRHFKGGLSGQRGQVVAMPGEFEKVGGLASRTGIQAALWGRRFVHAVRRSLSRAGS